MQLIFDKIDSYKTRSKTTKLKNEFLKLKNKKTKQNKKKKMSKEICVIHSFVNQEMHDVL
jgi:hypothetical protein